MLLKHKKQNQYIDFNKIPANYGFDYIYDCALFQKGDLVFFNFGSGIAHVGTYIGSGNMVHAANSQRGVRQDPVTSGYWKGVFAKARRYW